MTIQVGDKIPEGMFTVMGAEGPTGISTGEIFDGKKLFCLQFQAHLHRPVQQHICRVLLFMSTILKPRALIQLPVCQSMMYL